MQVRWLRKALHNLEQAYEFVAETDIEAAARTILEIQNAIDLLETFPRIGRVGRVDNTRELVVTDTPYIVIYRLRGNTVEIIRILHTSMKYP